MKINKIAGICKRAGMIRLYDEHTGDMQWCGTDAAIYPLYSLPVLDSDTVGPVIAAAGEKYIGEPIFQFLIGGTVYNAYHRPIAGGVLFVNAGYLKPLLGGEDDPELYLRGSDSLTNEYIAVKQGLMLAAIIEPEINLLSASLINSVTAFATAVNNEIHRLDGIPDIDPETGEIL